MFNFNFLYFFIKLVLALSLLSYVEATFADAIDLIPNQKASLTEQPLAANQAFQLRAHFVDPQTLVMEWTIAPGYYLYQHAFYFQSHQPKELILGQPLLPPGEIKTIPQVGRFTVYEGKILVGLPILQHTTHQAMLLVYYQGCSQQGYCYPPMKQLLSLDFNASSQTYFTPLEVNEVNTASFPERVGQEEKWSKLMNGHWPLAIMGFFIFGLLLSFTPCILPMIPILSSLIVGRGIQDARRNFTLSLTYVLSMALTYAGLGVLFSLLGQSIQASLQTNWAILGLSTILVLMSLSLFGFYHVELPQCIRKRAAHLSSQQSSGHYYGAAVMGCVSTLILSPCATPPLIAALSYVGQTGNTVFGASVLFAMGLGTGVPLLLIGGWGPKLLPKTGAWMNEAKNFLGWMLLVLVVVLLSRLISPLWTLLLTAGLLIGTALCLGALSTAQNFKQWVYKILALVLLIYGLLLVFSVLYGNTQIWPPLRHVMFSTKQIDSQRVTVRTLAEVSQQMAQAPHRPVILDFYASWCLACHQLDAEVFSNQEVQQKLKTYLVLRVDISNSNANTLALQQHFQVIAPPTLLFFNKQHQELKAQRVVGTVSAQQFFNHLSKININQNE